MTVRVDHVGTAGGTNVARLSEKVEEISTPPGTVGVSVVKLLHVRMTRPVSMSTSANSLSAASPARGVVAGGMSYGPDHVWPLSVERCTPIVWTAVPPTFFTTIEKYTNVEPP